MNETTERAFKKDIQEGDTAQVQLHDYGYTGLVVGISPVPYLRTGEPSEQYMVSVKCKCCGLVEPIPERYVTVLPKDDHHHVEKVEMNNGTEV